MARDDPLNFPFTPRDYQLTARYDVNRHLSSGGNPILVMPTGTGKSKTSSMIISDQIRLGKTVYVICPQVEIFSQLMDDYSFLNPGYVNDEGMRGRNRHLYVCMAISLYNILGMIDERNYPDIIITDESHHSAANTWEGIYSYFPKALRIGMTATPVRTDGKPLGDLYDKIIEPITIREALYRGYLTEPIVISPEEYEAHIPTDETKEDREKQAEVLGDPKIIGDVIDTYERILNGKPMLVACATYEHAEKVRDEFRSAGWVSDHIHSKLQKHERKRMLSGTASGRINVLTTVGIGIEGMDIPGLYALAWLRRTMSTTIFVQFNGRPMRLSDGKENCFIFDFVGNCVIHGMPDRVRKWSLKTGEDDEEDKEPFKKCWSCGTNNNPDNTECHWCGADLTDESKIPGTCPTCKYAKFDHCCFECHLWEKFPGCPSWKSRGRKLPAIVDGKLIAITTDGQRQEIQERIDAKKEEIQEAKEKEAAKKNRAEKISSVEKRKALQAGLFANTSRKSLFQEALNK
jgi:DNA repair protein RadD